MVSRSLTISRGSEVSVLIASSNEMYWFNALTTKLDVTTQLPDISYSMDVPYVDYLCPQSLDFTLHCRSSVERTTAGIPGLRMKEFIRQVATGDLEGIRKAAFDVIMHKE